MTDEKNNAGTEIEGALLSTYSKTEHFIHDNRKMLSYVLVGAVALILGVIGFKYFQNNRETEAQKRLFWAQQMLEQDSFKLALNGDASNYGFLKVKDKFGWTKAANLCNYYSGVCYLNTGDFKKAIESLNDFSSADDVLEGYKLCMIGDANMELNNTEEGLKYYKKAADNTENEFAAPYFIMKAGNAMEHMKKFADAKEMYERIKTKYVSSQQFRQIDAYIARCEASL
jgi:tetratricopeptide (TPR) repeat protein